LGRNPFTVKAFELGMVELPFAIGTVQLGASFVQQRSYMLLALAPRESS
jgi:hypothetical protein